MKNFLGFLLVVAVVAAVAVLVWKFGFSQQVLYEKPLETLTENTFNPPPDTDDAAQVRRIHEIMARSQQRASSQSGRDIDRLTVQLCQTLLDTRRQRAEYRKRITEMQKRNYQTLGNKEQAKKARTIMVDAIKRNANDYEKDQRERCESILQQIRRAGSRSE